MIPLQAVNDHHFFKKGKTNIIIVVIITDHSIDQMVVAGSTCTGEEGSSSFSFNHGNKEKYYPSLPYIHTQLVPKDTNISLHSMAWNSLVVSGSGETEEIRGPASQPVMMWMDNVKKTMGDETW